MNKLRKYILICIFVLIVLSTIISLSYAFYVVLPNNTSYDVVSKAELPSCLKLKLTDKKLFSLKGDYAIPIKDSRLLKSSSEVLNNYKYSFTLENACSNDENVTLSLAPLINNTLNIDAIKYALVEEGGNLPTEGKFVNVYDNGRVLNEVTIAEVKQNSNVDIKLAFKLLSVIVPANSQKNYDLYLWVDYNEGDRTGQNQNNGTTMDKIFSSVVVISDYRGSSKATDAPYHLSCNDNSLSCYVAKKYNIDGENALYWHDEEGNYTNSDLEAGDKSYRYAGANPNNFVCFGSNDETCPNDNLYRIIGVFEGKTKLIKYDYANQDILGTDGDAKAGHKFIASQRPTYRGPSSFANIYYWNNSNNYDENNADTTKSTNNWEESNLNKINLNTNYINSIGSTWSSMIDDAYWNIKKLSASGSIYTSNAKMAYSNLYNENYLKTSVASKVALMDVTDYFYAASPIHWSKAGHADDASHADLNGNYGEEYDYRSAINDNWIYMGLSEWILTRTDSTGSAVYIREVGRVSWTAVYENSKAVRPVFYLKNNILYNGGNGTITNPYRISI